jgi:FG-GAP-like repeat/Abnormal spindle-like microcephaly-assoc'd, ASPM-SPD-2-Hydin
MRKTILGIVNAFLVSACALAWLATGARAQGGPLPLINQPLVPDAVASGGPDFTLTVNGTGFVQGATVNWNGSPLTTTYVSESVLTAIVPASDIAAPGTASVIVSNPGVGVSNTALLSVRASIPLVAFLRTDYSTPTNPQSVVAGDFNGDGNPDLAVTSSSGVSILLGNGSGSFQAPVTYPYGAGQQPYAILAADFNGDGKLDLAFSLTLRTSVIAVSLGNGDGTFGPPAEFAVGLFPVALAAGDLNGDGRLDLAVADGLGGQVSILLGNGDGTFQTFQEYPVSAYSYGVAIGDFNADGNLDLGVASNSGKSGAYVLLGNGDGTFQSAVGYGVGSFAREIVTADVNFDGNLDLTVVNNSGNSLSVLLGNGDGTFQKQVTYPVPAGSDPSSVAAVDFNGDGKLDLAASNSVSNSVSVLLGNGDGTFQKQSQFATGTEPYVLGVADFNNDGLMDIVTSNWVSSTVSVLLQTQAPSASLSATSLAYGDQALGAVSPRQRITLTNIGAANLSVSGISVSDKSFLESNNCPASLAPFEHCTISVGFKPLSSGAHSGEVAITDNGPGSPQTISLSGTGTFIGLSPSSLNFGTIKVRQTSSPQTVTVTNVATFALSIRKIQTSSSKPEFTETNTCGSSLPAGASCTISVTFTPATTGALTALLGVYDNGAGSPQTVALTGTGD